MSICAGADSFSTIDVYLGCYKDNNSLDYICSSSSRSGSCSCQYNDLGNKYECKPSRRKRTSRKLRRKVHH